MLFAKFLALFLMFLSVPASADYLDNKISELVKLKQEKIEQLEKCQKARGGLMAAGIATLGVSAIGIGANIGEAIALKDYDTKIDQAKLTINNLNIEIAAKQDLLNNSCGKIDSCTTSPNLESMNAKEVECIDGLWKIISCANLYYGNGINSCTRDGDLVYYYEECLPVGKDGRDGKDGLSFVIIKDGVHDDITQETDVTNMCDIKTLNVNHNGQTVIDLSGNQDVTVTVSSADAQIISAEVSNNKVTLKGVGTVGAATTVTVKVTDKGGSVIRDCSYQVTVANDNAMSIKITQYTGDTPVEVDTVAGNSCGTDTLDVYQGKNLTIEYTDTVSSVTSSDTSVVTVGGQGTKIVTVAAASGVAAGRTATVTVTRSDGKQCTYTVTIVSKNDTVKITQYTGDSTVAVDTVAGNSCGTDTLNVYQGKNLTIEYADTVSSVTSSDESVVTVSGQGTKTVTVTAASGVAVGSKATVTVTRSDDTQCTYTVTIVSKNDTVKITQYTGDSSVAVDTVAGNSCGTNTLDVYQGKSLTIEYTDAVSSVISSDESVVTVSGQGTKTVTVTAASGVAAGRTATVTVTRSDNTKCTYAVTIVSKNDAVKITQYTGDTPVEVDTVAGNSCGTDTLDVYQGKNLTIEYTDTVSSVTSSDTSVVTVGGQGTNTVTVTAASGVAAGSTATVTVTRSDDTQCTYAVTIVSKNDTVKITQYTGEVLVTVTTENNSQEIQIKVDKTKEFDSNTASANCDGVVAVTGAALTDLEILYADLSNGQTATYTTTPIQVTKDNSPKTIGIIINHGGKQRYKGSFSCSIGQETVTPGTTTISFSNENTAGAALECGGNVTVRENQSQTWTISGAVVSDIFVNNKDVASVTTVEGRNITVTGNQVGKTVASFNLTDANNKKIPCSINVNTVLADSPIGTSTSTENKTKQIKSTVSNTNIATDDILDCRSGEIGFYTSIPLYEGAPEANPILQAGYMQLQGDEVAKASNNAKRYEYKYRYGFCGGKCGIIPGNHAYFIACKDGFYLNVTDLAVGSSHSRDGGGTSSFIAAYNKDENTACLATCNGVEFEYVIRGDNRKSYGTFKACLATNNGLFERCKNSCREHMLDLRTNNADSCNLNYAALDIKNKKCLCNPPGQNYDTYEKITNTVTRTQQ